MTILIPATTVNEFLQLACLLLNINATSHTKFSPQDRSFLESVLALSRWYEDLPMAMYAT
jgi:hypothetical protein